MGGEGDSPSSSIDSSSHPLLSSASSTSQPLKRDLSTDLRLGLSISTACYQQDDSIKERSNRTDKGNRRQQQATFFVKVYMEGIPIGRKLDLFAHNCYDDLIRTLGRMFRTTIICPDAAQVSSNKTTHVLTYEDKEGDWMMVGDVPWEMFLTTVKRLKITRADKC